MHYFYLICSNFAGLPARYLCV
uniref:Uncharacterized protein n=1 Tax=Anguilla anguilla TaxID=7936 RepID=A0A0E9UWE1_ANGAN